jgi:hypothetical protein
MLVVAVARQLEPLVQAVLASAVMVQQIPLEITAQ